MAETLPLNDTGTHVHVQHSVTGARWDSPIGYLPTAQALGWEPAERVDEGQPINAIADAQPVEQPEQPAKKSRKTTTVPEGSEPVEKES